MTPPYFSGVWDIFMTFFILKKFFLPTIFSRVLGFVIQFSIYSTSLYFSHQDCGYLILFIYFNKCAHRGRGYLLLIFFPPSPIGASDTGCVLLFPKPLAHRGLGYLLFKKIIFYYCPSGLRIPAFIFFLAHRGRGYLLRFFF